MTATIIILYVAKMNKVIHFQDFDKSIPGKVIYHLFIMCIFLLHCHDCLCFYTVDISFTIAVCGESRDRTGRN